MNNQGKFAKAVKTLEFDKIKELLISLCPTESSKVLAQNLYPITSYSGIKQALDETTCAKNMQAIKGMPPLTGAPYVKEALMKAYKGGLMTTKELIETARVLQCAKSIKDYANVEHSDENALTEYFLRLITDNELERKINKCIISEDIIADDASDKLYDIRKRIKIENGRIKDTLNKYITGETYSKYLQDNIITMRDGRYVVPVKHEFAKEFGGIVHDTSSSGATVFMEPMAVVEANNKLKILDKEEKEEIERILYELSSMCAEKMDIILCDYENINHLAFVFAKSQLSYKLDCSDVELNDKGYIEIVKGRHPLLDMETAVPISVSLGKNFDTLVITGPNTGGKTVTLKTIGLLTLMVQSGLHVPASNFSSFSVFSDVLADIGDEQSIEQSLSTFSSHMVNVISITQKAKPNVLILLDELGAGTDPVEGAALAISILEDIREKGAICAATTHYAELKSYALTTKGVMNASCEFDIETLKPTYKLIIGTPGKSNAFAISQKLGLDEKIINRATDLISGEDREFENVISQLEKNRVEMEKAKDEAYKLLENAKKYEKEVREKIDKESLQSEKEVKKAHEQAVRMVESAKSSSEFIFSQIEKVKSSKEENKRELIERARKEMKIKLSKNADLLDPVNVKSNDDYVLPRPLKYGDKVIIVSLGQRGEVMSESDDKGNIQVRAGSAIIRLKVSDLRLDEETRKEEKKKINKSNTGSYGTAMTFSPSLDLRGKYADDAIIELDRYLDQARRSSINQVTIIHGKGTGALRSAVTNYLKKTKGIKSFRPGLPGEGDAGVTVIDLN